MNLLTHGSLILQGSLQELSREMPLFSCETANTAHLARRCFHFVSAMITKWGMNTI
jgi:hypothetical protein